MRLFYFVTFISTLLFVLFLFFRYEDIKTTLFEEQKYKTSLVANTAHVQFVHYEELLSLLGNHLLSNAIYKNKVLSQQLFESIFALNKEVLGFGLIDTQGNYLALSSNLDPKTMPNLLQKKETKETFLEAIASDKMVIGRTYYLANVDEWVVPLRKAIHDKEGHVIALMTVGLKLHSMNSFFNNFNLNHSHLLALVNYAQGEDSIYRIYYHGDENVAKEKLYNTPVETKIHNNYMESVMKMNHISADVLYNGDSIVSLPYSFKAKGAWGKSIYGALSYNQRYNYYTLTGYYNSYRQNYFFHSIKIYILGYLLSQLMLYLFFRYVSKLNHEKEVALAYESLHDSLTKLPNKKFLYENFGSFVQKNRLFALIYIDIDNFKNINDNFGHPVGDKLLREIAARVQNFIQKDAMLIREGGDELILLHGIEDEKSTHLYNDINKLLEETYVVDNMEFKLGSSIGIALYPKDSSDLTELLSMSDMAMYEAKKLKNTYTLYNSKLKEIQHKNVQIDQELRYALSREEVFVVYQPQINADGTLYGVEALIRWKSSKLGNVTPDVFIPIAEESNLIVGLGRFVIQRAIHEILEVKEKLNIPLQLSINLSIKQLLSSSFIENLLQDSAPLRNNYNTITFEITERLFIEDIDHVLPKLNFLKEKGFQISLDDFGTGYSSFSILKNLPINELKIDKSFIDELLVNNDTHIFSKSIITIGHDLSMKTVAEGVETQMQVALLKEQKCDIFQGYYFSKPLTKSDLIAYITDNGFIP